MGMENGTLGLQEVSDKCNAWHLQQLQSEWLNPFDVRFQTLRIDVHKSYQLVSIRRTDRKKKKKDILKF